MSNGVVDYNDPIDLYRNDAQFHAVVQALEKMLYEGEMSPNELCGAVMVALTNHYDMRRRNPNWARKTREERDRDMKRELHFAMLMQAPPFVAREQT